MNRRKNKKHDLRKKRNKISFVGVLKVPSNTTPKVYKELSDEIGKLNTKGEWIIIPDTYHCYITPLYSPKSLHIRNIIKILK